MGSGRVKPFVQLLGFQITLAAEGRSQVDYEPIPDHMNSFQMVHGGVLMSLLDVAMSQAGHSLRPDTAMLTIEMKTSFMRAAKGKLVARGRVVHTTATMAFCEAQVLDAEGKLCAAASGTFKYAKRPPVDPATARQERAAQATPPR